MDTAAVAQILGAIVVLLTAGAGVVGYFRANVSKATIELYKEDNNALRDRLKTLEDQQSRDRAEIKALQSARQYLTSVVTQADNIAALQHSVAANYDLLTKVAKAVGA